MSTSKIAIFMLSGQELDTLLQISGLIIEMMVYDGSVLLHLNGASIVE